MRVYEGFRTRAAPAIPKEAHGDRMDRTLRHRREGPPPDPGPPQRGGPRGRPRPRFADQVPGPRKGDAEGQVDVLTVPHAGDGPDDVRVKASGSTACARPPWMRSPPTLGGTPSSSPTRRIRQAPPGGSTTPTTPKARGGTSRCRRTTRTTPKGSVARPGDRSTEHNKRPVGDATPHVSPSRQPPTPIRTTIGPRIRWPRATGRKEAGDDR